MEIAMNLFNVIYVFSAVAAIVAFGIVVVTAHREGVK
jgi:hypothetical protein